MSALTPDPDGAILAVRVTPRARKDETAGLGLDAEGRTHLNLRVRAAPSDGEANKAVIALIAKLFGAPKSHIELVSGATQRIKRLRLRGDPDDLAAAYRRVIDEAR